MFMVCQIDLMLYLVKKDFEWINVFCRQAKTLFIFTYDILFKTSFRQLIQIVHAEYYLLLQCDKFIVSSFLKIYIKTVYIKLNKILQEITETFKTKTFYPTFSAVRVEMCWRNFSSCSRDGTDPGEIENGCKQRRSQRSWSCSVKALSACILWFFSFSITSTWDRRSFSCCSIVLLLSS